MYQLCKAFRTAYACQKIAAPTIGSVTERLQCGYLVAANDCNLIYPLVNDNTKLLKLRR